MHRSGGGAKQRPRRHWLRTRRVVHGGLTLVLKQIVCLDIELLFIKVGGTYLPSELSLLFTSAPSYQDR